jgi:hypothetical protein
MSEIITPMNKEEKSFLKEFIEMVKNEHISDEDVNEHLFINYEHQKSGEIKIKLLESIRDNRKLMYQNFLTELPNLMRQRMLEN